METYKKLIIAGAIAAGIGIIAYAEYANAADLGGNCCADLEERIAELEATTARKGNKKVSLQVYGQVNRALLIVDADDENDQFVIENAAEPTHLGFTGKAAIRDGFSAGFKIELGFGDDGLKKFYGYVRDENTLSTRYAFGFIETPAGKISLGLASESTDGISQISVANVRVAAPLLSVKPATLNDSTDLWDGSRRDLVRYDSPSLAGFYVSAAWFSASEGYDVALRYGAEAQGFRFAAGVGYKKDENPVVVWLPLGLFGVETETYSGSASVMHITSGLFVNAAYGRLNLDAGTKDADVTAWHVQAGVENKFFEAGKTTLFVEYLSGDLDINSTKVGDADFWGAGVVQNLGGAVDLYATGRHSSDIDTTLGLVGLRVAF